MQPRLDTLEMEDDRRESARRQIQDMAYCKWLEAGCPTDCDLQFWVEAEEEWIRYYYTPNRYSTLRSIPR